MEVVVKKKQFGLGTILCITFFVLLFIIHSNAVVSINGKSLLRYTDAFFVSLSKGSVYFIPELLETSERYRQTTVDITIDGDPKTALLFEKANAAVTLKNGRMQIKGHLGPILNAALKDADAVFKGEDARLSHTYGYPGKKAVHLWWRSFKQMEGAYKKSAKFEEIKILNTLRTKALEPAYNFYETEAASASEHAFKIISIVLFYVIYTVWWGFAILFLFEGIGLLMTKSKLKKEA